MVFDTIRKARAAEPETVRVWAASVDIARGSSIDESMLTTFSMPNKMVPEGAFTEEDELIGRVPRITAPAGLPILESMLLEPGAMPGLWVKPGYRAVSIKIDESSGVSNLLQPGSFVDVIGFFRVQRGKKQENVSRTLIENVEVAAVGQTIEPTEKEKDGRGGVSNRPARAVTLFVHPKDVPEIHLAEQRGKLKLALRSNGDYEISSNDDFTTESSVVGVEDETEDGRPTSTGKPALLDRMLGLFSGNKEKPSEDSQATAQVASGQPTSQKPEPVWKVVVWNGNQRKIFGWDSMNSMDPMVLSGRNSQGVATAGPPPNPMIRPTFANNNAISPAGTPHYLPPGIHPAPTQPGLQPQRLVPPTNADESDSGSDEADNDTKVMDLSGDETYIDE
jgi:pilus assembly protein CpaB